MATKSRTVPINEVPTRILLRERSYVKCWSECECEFCSNPSALFRQFGTDHDGTHVGFFASQTEIHAALATREHVPNKKEGENNRRHRQSTRHGFAKSKDR